MDISTSTAQEAAPFAASRATQGDLASVVGGLGLTVPIVYMLFRKAHRLSRRLENKS